MAIYVRGTVAGKREREYDMRDQGGNQGVSYQIKITDEQADAFSDGIIVKCSAAQFVKVSAGDDVDWPVNVVARGSRLDYKLPADLVVGSSLHSAASSF